MFEHLSQYFIDLIYYFEILTPVIMFVTLLVIIWYTVETKKMRISNQENLELLEKRSLKDEDREAKEGDLIRFFVLSQVDVLSTAAKDQLKKVEKLLVQLKLDKIISFEFWSIVDFDSKRVRVIKPTNIFELFVLDFPNKPNRLSQFNILQKQLDLVDGLRDSFVKSFNYLNEHSNKYQDEWNKNIEIIGDKHDKWITDLTSQNIDPTSDPFLSEFINIYLVWAETEQRRDMYIAENTLIQNVLSKARELQPNEYGEALLRPLLRCIDAIQNHRNLRDHIIKENNYFKTSLEGMIASLSKVKKEFAK